MKHFIPCLLWLQQLSQGRRTPLDDYVNKPDSTYKYEILERKRGPNYTVYNLNMTSQTWKPDIVSQSVWWHQMTVIIPDKIDMDSAFMLIDGGLNDERPAKLTDKFSNIMKWVATSTNSVAAMLKQIPNQPIVFKDDPASRKRKEDDIIAWTWKRFIEGNGSDPEILLRMPMTKAAVRGIDTVQDLALKVANLTVKRFLVTGASKRGWATWTTGAVDNRVVAIAPVVMDLLGLVKNLHHYYRSLGGWTFAFLAYYETDFTSMIDRPATQLMADIVDPISYRERYKTKPKFITSTGGDEFFMIDDSRFYYNQLLGETYLRMMPNTDHQLKGHITDVFTDIKTFYLSVMKGKSLPILTWETEYTHSGAKIILKCDRTPRTVQVYHATTLSSKRKDFRMYHLTPGHPFQPVYNPVIWYPSKTTIVGENKYMAEVDNPAKGWTAFFIEATFSGYESSVLRFTTETLITPDTYYFPDCHGDACRGTLV